MTGMLTLRLLNFVTNQQNKTNFFTSLNNFEKIVKNVFPVKQHVSITTKSFKIHDKLH